VQAGASKRGAIVGMFDDFSAGDIYTRETTIFIRSHGSGPPILLLHGFPETHVMWRDVAPILARSSTVVCADLRGYGRSGCPGSTNDHEPYAKRALARDMIDVMEGLGCHRFAVAGHDRGARVAYRLALDHPDRISRVAVLDVVPTEAVWERADARFAVSFWPWSLLAQPAPLPERVLSELADAVLDDALGGWGSPATAFPADVRRAYRDALSDPAHAHAICEEYRAAAAIDREHDRQDRATGRKIVCPLLALWSAAGPIGTMYRDEGGPLALWRAWANDVRGHEITGGHFFPEEAPEMTAAALRDFFEP
jgi:haloacetate dehalogenase